MSGHIYNVNLQWTVDRKGIMDSPELVNKIEVATPPQFPKGVEGVWSPEHLFTSAVLSCFMTTFLAIAENSKLEFTSFSCKAEGILDQVDGKYQMTAVLLKPSLVITKEADKERAERILHKSDAACLISNSVKSTIELQPEISW